MSGEARRLAAIMFTDIVGYSALTQKNEALTDELLQEHNDVVRAMLPQFGGKEIKTIGDAFHVEFASALDATRCAIAIQKALIEHNASALPERRIQLRIGLHVGDVMPREEDVFGDTVNIASRIVPLAEPGGICISEDVAHQIRNKIEARLVSLGRPDARRVRRLAIGLLVVAILGGTIWFVSPHIGWLPPTTANPNGVKTVTEPKPASAMKWIAVLPFDNTSNDAANEYFSDGMTDELISALSQVEGLRVIARTTAFMFKGKKGNVHKIGEQLNVGIVLDGSVQKAGEKIRISAHLLNATDGSELWAKTYDRELKDAFATQDEIAQAIVNVLKIKLGQPVVKPSTANQAAHDLYLRGRYSQSQATEEAIEKAIEYYEQAIAKDPNYALAYAALSGAYTALPGLSSVPAKEFYDKAKVAALKAVELDDGLPEAHLAVADNKYFMEGNYTDAEKEYKRALELDPNHEQVLLGYASFLYDQDRKEEALAIVEHVLERDPLNVDVKLQAADWFNY
ncbi:tetratricopeptide repeat protein [Candidatus Acetothermia bacterium]|nr:tetratricopeptide repeat protein [Candidatus Acetothermia bacterium]